MPDEEKILIARFLRANDYSQTLSLFLAEAGLSEDAGSSSTKDDLTLEKLLQEKRAYDLAANFERLGTVETAGWRVPAPTTPTQIRLSTSSNVLSLAVQAIQSEDGSSWSCVHSSGADRRVSIIDCNTLQPLESFSSHEAPILCIVPVLDYLISGDMAGNVILTTKSGDRELDRRKDHAKYVVKLAVSEQIEGAWIASAGWDAKVYLYWLPKTADPPKLQSPVAKIGLPTNPEAMLFVREPDSDELVLILSRRDSTFLYYYAVPDTKYLSQTDQSIELKSLGRQNLAPHALSWVTFTPSDIALCPTDGTKVAVATSSMPHMKVLVVRLIFPANPELALPNGPLIDHAHTPRATTVLHDEVSDGSDIPVSGAVLAARAQRALQDREEAAIIISCNTMAPQTQYSTPAVVWRPDASGCFVNGDDGVIRGIEVSSGKVVCKLQAHDSGSKVRCLWAGNIEVTDDVGATRSEEWLVSGGFDRRLVVWR